MTAPGSQIGGYRIKEQIALGGFGTVWRAQHVDTGQIAAIKVLHAYLVSSDTLVQRFEREADAIDSMNHPNIVKLYKHGRLRDGRPYLIMEFLEGVDLGTQIAIRGTLLPKEILQILDQLGSALAAAHKREIVHRDLKASNVFLSKDENGELRVVLFDFGIAKLLGRDGPNLTMSSSLVGSPACMSPEQILGRPVDPRTDIYALGSLTYQMLVGHPPFSGASPTAILTMHLEDYPPYPSLHGDVSPAFDNVIMKAMSKDSDERYQNVEDFVEAFRQAVQESKAGRTSSTLLPSRNPALAKAALGLFLDVSADPSALDDPEDSLLDDMEAIVPEAMDMLEERGYLVAYERGTSALFVRPLDATNTTGRKFRKREVTFARQLFTTLQARPGRDPAVHVRIYLHMGDATIIDDAIEGGSLLDTADWTPVATASGVFASSEVLADHDLLSETIGSRPSIQRVTPHSDEAV